MKKKLLSVALATIIAVMAISGASLAWLQDTTQTVTNTFTEGVVDIELNETTGNTYHMVPGNVLSKDPTVVVKASSEACYLFVKIEEVNDVDTFLTYEIADGWTQLEGVDGVYYREVADTDADQTFYVLKGNTMYPNGIVSVNKEVTVAQMNALTEKTRPQLKFTAYAIQKANTGTAAEAWALMNP